MPVDECLHGELLIIPAEIHYINAALTYFCATAIL